jgi:hypothetical protein
MLCQFCSFGFCGLGLRYNYCVTRLSAGVHARFANNERREDEPLHTRAVRAFSADVSCVLRDSQQLTELLQLATVARSFAVIDAIAIAIDPTTARAVVDSL